MTQAPTLVDVTLRDGGYANGHSWSRADASAIVSACSDANIPFTEIGYFRPQRHISRGANFPAECCPPDYLAELHERFPHITLVAMIHSKDVELSDYKTLADAGVGLIRLTAQLGVLPNLEPHVAAAKEAGLRVSVNLIRVSELNVADVAKAGELASRFGADVFYVADSNGSLFPKDIAKIVGVARASTDALVGFHAHDDLSLAFINALTALDAGCDYIDASLGGMGKNGGNLSIELMASYLRARYDAPFVVQRLAQTSASVLAPWKGDKLITRLESIISGLLDLNMDTLGALKNDDKRNLFSVFDTMQDRDHARTLLKSV
jgi:4-hydroxy 2-oxovalerate aldolase